MEQYVDKMLPIIRNALVAAAEADYSEAKHAGVTEEEMAVVVVLDAVSHILHEAELL